MTFISLKIGGGGMNEYDPAYAMSASPSNKNSNYLPGFQDQQQSYQQQNWQQQQKLGTCY